MSKKKSCRNCEEKLTCLNTRLNGILKPFEHYVRFENEKQFKSILKKINDEVCEVFAKYCKDYKKES